MGTRRVIIAVLLVIVVGLAAYAGWWRLHGKAVPGAASYGPVPEGGLVIQREGTDEFGYPLSYVDRTAVLALLHRREFDRLTRELDAFEQQLHADYHHEYFYVDALDAFSVDDPELLPLLDSWVDAKPNSAVAFEARAEFLVAVAESRRGMKYAQDTTDDQFQQMHDANAEALKDLKRARELRPGSIDAALTLLGMGMNEGAEREALRTYLDEMVKSCPDCYRPRVQYMVSLAPRWGGTDEDADAFAKESMKASKNPRMVLLTGYVAMDQCRLANEDDGEPVDETLCTQAISVGKNWWFYGRRGIIRQRHGDHKGALADLNEALRLSPQQSDLLDYRARALDKTGDFVKAAADIALMARLNPHDPEAISLASFERQQLLNKAKLAHDAHDQPTVERYLDAALTLAPNDKLLRHLRGLPPPSEN